MPGIHQILRRLRLRHLLFLLLLGSGILPLAINGILLVRQNRELFETQEKAFLTRSAAALSRELNDHLLGLRRQLQQVGVGLLALSPAGDVAGRLREPWVGPYLEGFLRSNSAVIELQVLDVDGAGPRFAPSDLAEATAAILDPVFDQAVESRRPAYGFAVLPRTNEPVVALSLPVLGEDGRLELVVQSVARLRLIEAVLEREAQGDVQTFLVDRQGRILWSVGATPEVEASLANSDLLRDFARKPLNLTSEYQVLSGGREVRMVGRVSPVDETGWGIVVHKPSSMAFLAARQMAWTAVISTLLLVLLALLFAAVISRWVGGSIQVLAQTTHEIAAGNFDRRLPEEQMTNELAELAHDFNRMGGHVKDYVAQLQQAASANQQLFISAIRAFAAAIDAKDPYTRGHSERVAAISRVIGRHLGQSEEFQERLWIGALLHDIGKIGIEDRVLNKRGVLTGEEYEQMKRHPTIGADILAPLEALQDSLPAVRWHHENWNGRGYPDGLRGEEIPLMARVVAVADCFDAITTSRPYQTAYEPAVAVETITKIAGTRFDAKVVTAFLRAFEAGELELVRPGRDEAELPVAASH